jgi:hypothetical protein
LPFSTKEQRKLYQREYRQKQKLRQDTLEGFLKAKGNCEECNRNPAVLITPDIIPLCALHWNLLADGEIEWGIPLTEQQCQALLTDLTTHRKVLEGVKATMVCLNDVWHVKA